MKREQSLIKITCYVNPYIISLVNYESEIQFVLPVVVCRRAHLCHLCLFAYNGVQNDLAILVTWPVSYKRKELFCFPKHLGYIMVSGVVRVAHLYCNLLCCVVFLCFTYVCPVSYVSFVASVSGLTIHDCPFGFYKIYSRWCSVRIIYTCIAIEGLRSTVPEVPEPCLNNIPEGTIGNESIS